MVKEAVTIKATSTDPTKKDDPTPESQKKHPEKPEDATKAEDDLSDEDQKLKDDLELAVQRVTDQQESAGVQKLALETLRSEIRTATSSMTSVPKPLKFLRPFYDVLKVAYENFKDPVNKKSLSDILAVLAMTMAKEGTRESLTFKLAGHPTDLGSWGHEFVRSLCGEIGREYAARTTGEDAAGADVSDLFLLVDAIVPFHIQHNAEPEAIDILIEVQQLEKILLCKDIDGKNYQRVCVYLLACADYMSDQDDLQTLLYAAYELYKRMKQYPDALRVALRQNKIENIKQTFADCPNEMTKKQMAYILGRHRLNYEYEEDEGINDIISNTSLNEHYLHLAADLDTVASKTPEDIYKSHLSETGSTARSRDASRPGVDSARANLASTFVNAFVNAGYGTDQLMTPEGNAWLYKNKEHGMMSAAASLGMIMQWNVEEGLTQIDKFLYSGEDYIKAGAILAVGIVSSGVRNDCDPALALLSEHLENTNDNPTGKKTMAIAASMGLGLAYCGSNRDDVGDILIPVVANTDATADMKEVSFAALSLGLIFVGTCDENVGSVLMQRLMESSEVELNSTNARFLVLALGLLFLGQQDRADAMLEAVRTIEHPEMGKYAAITLDTCAYAGTGNVLKVQEMLHMCAEHPSVSGAEGEEEEAKTSEKNADEQHHQYQSVAVLGIALVTMGETIGSDMAIRTFDYLLQYGELSVKRAVPLALCLLDISNPEYTVVDTLSRLSHDADAQVSMNAILALGFVAAGTNNSRVAGLLRQLSDFYYREANHLFIVRIAQGLLHLGKGLLTLHPFHSDRLLLSSVSMCGLLTVLHAALDLKHTILDQSHYILFYLVTAMHPRMLITLDEDLNPLPVTVRVGQAVEVVGQAGRPKTITGFQTHTTPVLMNVNERAQLASDEYLPCSNVLEGLVILKKNPDYDAEA